jgi:EF-P beta-lysylation protein EpmB
MVPRSLTACQTSDWKQELAEAYRNPDELLTALGLANAQIPDLDRSGRGLRLLVPRAFAALMRHGDPQDPLLRQVLPLGAERRAVDGFSDDPVGDAAADRGQGLLRKYAGRVLILASGACAVHCRYCFRRHRPPSPALRSGADLDALMRTIDGDPELSEVILSGGDPLMLEDAQLAELLDALAGIAHVRRLRIHTRLPVVLPSRVTPGLCRALTRTRLRPVVVLHANHPRELGGSIPAALQALRSAGLTLLNQSVLLRGVNASPGILIELCERLFDCGVLPYYLHQLDPVHGAAHFEVTDAEALALDRRLRAHLPGYLVPRLVREVPGAPAKTPLAECSVESRAST